MAAIVLLPDSMIRSWREFEKWLSSLYAQHGSDAAEKAHVLAQIKPVFMRCATVGADVPPQQLSEAVEQVNEWARRIVGGAIGVLLLREIELYRQRGSGSAEAPIHAAGEPADGNSAFVALRACAARAALYLCQVPGADGLPAYLFVEIHKTSTIADLAAVAEALRELGVALPAAAVPSSIADQVAGNVDRADGAEVVRLPDLKLRSWLQAEVDLAEIYRQHGDDQAEEAYVLAQLKPVFLRYATLGLDCYAQTGEQVLQQLNNWAHGIIVGVLFALMLREMELYRLAASANASMAVPASGHVPAGATIVPLPLAGSLPASQRAPVEGQCTFQALQALAARAALYLCQVPAANGQQRYLLAEMSKARIFADLAAAAGALRDLGVV